LSSKEEEEEEEEEDSFAILRFLFKSTGGGLI
jgi:hypothetical protein